MIAMAVAVSAWSFWPAAAPKEQTAESIAAGKTTPGLWCVDAETREPLLGLLPRGWFIWLTLAPADASDRRMLDEELARLEKTWPGMADIDRWRRVVVASNAQQLRQLEAKKPGPEEVPFDAGLATKRTWATWGQAARIRHVLIEPTGRILMIEPGEAEKPGVLKRFADEIRRRLKAWEGNFDDQPRFS